MREKLLIIDDEVDLLELLLDYFELSNYEVSAAQSAKAALPYLEWQPDLILLDVNMPEMDGFEFCKQIREIVHCPIIFLSAKIDDASRMEGLMVGGDDYIVKPFLLEELGVKIHAHLRREKRLQQREQVAFSGDLVILYDRKEVHYQGAAIDLTKTEFEIIQILSKRAGHVYSKELIYEQLWGYEKEGDSAIIMEHIRRIRKKLAAYGLEDKIQTVWGLGYKWIG